jgi:zinc metalloprotease ZmpB
MASTVTSPTGTERALAANRRSLLHHRGPFTLDQAVSPPDDVWRLAKAYVRVIGDQYGLSRDDVLAARTVPVCGVSAIDAADASPLLRRAERRRLGRTTTAVFQQSQFGVPVWGAFLAVQIQHADVPYVVSSQQSLRFVGEGTERRLGVDLEPPRGREAFGPGRDAFNIFDWMLRARTGLRLVNQGRPREQIFIYRYDERARLGLMEASTFGFQHSDVGPVHRRRDRFVTEVVARSQDTGLWWRALIDLETGAALYLRALAANVSPQVLLFGVDPVTCDGAAHALTWGPGNWDNELDRYRGQLAPTAVPADETIMKSEFAEVVEIAPPPLRPPDVTGVGALESRDRYLPYVRGDYFARATAVYHLDRCVRTLESIGVDVAGFFTPAAGNGTNQDARPSLPIGVDPCVESIAGINMATNAMTLGNASGVEGVCIGELAVDAGVTAGADPRFIWHEFGHVLLFTRDPHSNGRLPFAHGIGDALSAIHFDPDSAVRGDGSLRGLCYPWFRNYRPHRIGRRHDWQFDEPEGMIWSRLDLDSRSEYKREEVLSSTLFRIYRAFGGDSTSSARRRLASNYVLFLIVQAIGAAKIEALTGPHELRELLIAADAGIDRGAFEDVPRGALEKVICWAFEEQGLDAWQDDTRRWRRSPPAVDLFIDPSPQLGDGAVCWPGYPASEFFWESTAIRNRLNPDDGIDHEEPRQGRDNFLYVRIRNRGRLNVPPPSIQVYHHETVLAPVWRDRNTCAARSGQWQQATPVRNTLPMPADSAAFQEAVFVWRPDAPGPWSFLAAVSATQSNAADCCSLDMPGVADRSMGRDRALWALAPHDNNLAIRSMSSAAGGSGARAFADSIRPALSLSNPYSHRACTARVAVELPMFLKRRGWCASVEPTSEAIALPPGGDCKLELRLSQGKDFSASDVPLDASERRLRIICVDVSHDPTDIHGIVLGGLTYEIDPNLSSPVA